MIGDDNAFGARFKSQNNLAHYIATLYDQSLTWQDLEWIVSMTKLPVLVKGILRFLLPMALHELLWGQATEQLQGLLDVHGTILHHGHY